MDIVKETQQILGSGEGELYKILPAYIQKLIEGKVWSGRKKRDGSEFVSFEDFVTTKLWHGLETTVADLKLYCKREPKVVRMIDEQIEPAKTHKEAGGMKGKAQDNIRSYGTSAQHTIARLKRDHPDLAEQVINGQLTANAAAIQAGFRKRTYSIQATPEAVSRFVENHLPGYRLIRSEG